MRGVRGRVASRFGGQGIGSRVGLIVVALLLGLLPPILAVAYLSVRDPLPPSCHSGLASSTSIDGVLTWSNGPTLWFADGDLSRGRRLVDYSPVRESLRIAPATPSPGASAAAPSPSASTVASPAPSASPSPTVEVGAPAIEAATITPDHARIAFLVSNPPDRPGMLSLRLVSPQDPPGTPPVEAWSGPWHPELHQRSEVVILAEARILFIFGARYDPPETSKRVVAVAEGGTTPHLIEATSERDFVTKAHSTWPETKNYVLPQSQPKLRDRVLGPDGVAAGDRDRVVKTLLVQRTLREIRAGVAGSPNSSVVCATQDAVTPLAVSPDGRRLAAGTSGSTYVLDLAGGRSLAFLLKGRALDWRS